MTTPRATLTETNEKWLGARTRVGEELSHIRELQTSRECANSELAPGNHNVSESNETPPGVTAGGRGEGTRREEDPRLNWPKVGRPRRQVASQGRGLSRDAPHLPLQTGTRTLPGLPMEVVENGANER